MSSDAARPSNRPTLIKTPDQLQQAKGREKVESGSDVARRRDPAEPATPRDGILGQLETERAHD